ncbi:MAG TPA: von Willebrand factor type A domain-containing protein [Phycicoccus sp.]|nr:von Willebrand factor type A domain-containing protein [Phycicoccus sp.]
MEGTTQRRFSTTTVTALLVALAAAGCAVGSDGSSSGPVAPGPNGARDSAPYPPPRPSEGVVRDFAMTDPGEDALSTFALDIDTGSYTRFRDAVQRGTRISPSEVRTEEFVNYFAQDYEAPREGLGVSIDAAVLPFRPDHRLVRVGIRSADVADASRPDADLVLVVDCSGSMGEHGKMETTKTALRVLASSLRPTDRVAMVCYSDSASVALEPTPVAERGALLDAIDALRPQSSTNAAAGLALGYDLAASMRSEGGSEGRMTRVVLVSDGVANVGETTPGGILERIGTQARAGTSLISVGVGIETYNDRLLEQLADRGDGWHVYIDSAAEAERVFATGLTGSLVVTARDAKAQVEFDPAQVAGYRLIGYENRAVADEDFRNDAVDGGEVFAGHATTALYDVELREGGWGTAPFVTATVRYRDGSGEAVEREARLGGSDCVTDLAEASPRLHQDLVVAMLTDRLVGGPWSQWAGPEVLRAAAEGLPGRLDGDPAVAELVGLVDRVTA